CLARAASQSTTPAATATLRLSTGPCAGTATRSSAASSHTLGRPCRSLPNTTAIAFLYVDSQYGFAAAGVVATIRISRLRSQASTRAVLAVAHGRRKTAPTETRIVSGGKRAAPGVAHGEVKLAPPEPRIVSGWKRSVRGSTTTNASTPAAQAVRAIAPRF